jgi:hypothetical protein
MKNLLLLPALLLSLLAAAQKPGDIEISLGGGLNFSNLSTNQFSLDTRVDYNLNAMAQVYITRDWGFKTGVFYDRKGANNLPTIAERDFLIYQDIELDYYTVPIMASYHFGRGWQWYVDFGLYVGILNRAEDENTGFDLSPDLEDTDVGLAMGIGFEKLVLPNGKVFFELNVQSGFTDVFEDRAIDGFDNYTTSRWALNVGYRFLLF